MENFNKLINIKFQTKQGEAFEIITPRKGVKPDITISGNLTMEGYTHTFEVRITNFYSNSIGEGTTLIVTAGYENNMSAGIYGEVQNIYTESPGPDKVTVISCVSAYYDQWINNTIDLQLESNFKLTDAIAQVSHALDYDPALIDTELQQLTCTAPLMHNGRCSEALQKIRDLFPGIAIVVQGKKLRVFSTGGKSSTIVVHAMPLLTQAPQYTGGAVSLVAPWDPMIKPGDYVRFPDDFYTASLGAIKNNVAKVNTIQFQFSTCDDQNEMIVTGTVEAKLKESAT